MGDYGKTMVSSRSFIIDMKVHGSRFIFSPMDVQLDLVPLSFFLKTVPSLIALQTLS